MWSTSGTHVRVLRGTRQVSGGVLLLACRIGGSVGGFSVKKPCTRVTAVTRSASDACCGWARVWAGRDDDAGSDGSSGKGVRDDSCSCFRGWGIGAGGVVCWLCAGVSSHALW